MLYALTMTGSHEAAVPVRRKNPFNGQFVDIYPPALTDTEASEAKRVLARYGARVEIDGRHILQLSDGTAIEVIVGLGEGEPGLEGIVRRVPPAPEQRGGAVPL